MQRLIPSLIQNVIISVHLLCVGDLSLITSDQEDESIWKIDCEILSLKHRPRVLLHNSF